MRDAAQPYTTDHVVEYAYKRSLGPVLSRFFTALRDGQILGSRTAEGRVLVPPMEHDPDTGDGLDADDMVAVGPGGRVTAWTWIARASAVRVDHNFGSGRHCTRPYSDPSP